MQKYNPNVPNPSCQGARGKNPCYDSEQINIYNKYAFFKAMRLISIDAQLKSGKESLETLRLDMRLEWEEHIKNVNR